LFSFSTLFSESTLAVTVAVGATNWGSFSNFVGDLIETVDFKLANKNKKHKDYDRKLWNPVEDEALQRFVDKNGTQSWTHIAELLNNQFELAKPRSAKQCRERWHGHLDPSKGINKAAFTPEEEQKLLELQRELGSKWAEIARRLPGRTDNNCKNHWYSYMRKQNRLKGELSADSVLLSTQTIHNLILEHDNDTNSSTQ
jgi:myb proto-oncogene protein